MPRKSGTSKSDNEGNGGDRSKAGPRAPHVRRRTIKGDDNTSQLLEQGFGFPGEDTWGEAQSAAERRTEQGRSGPGRGPRGSRRSGDALARELHEILTQDPELDSSEIEVEVDGTTVTLTGTVDSSDAKLLAEELVESVVGVQEVHNHLKIAR